MTGAAAAPTGGWEAVLDDIERRLEGHRASLDEGTPPPPLFVLPPGLGPIPEHLRARAGTLLAATRATEARVGERRDAVAAQLGERASEARPPVYFDQRV